MRKIGYFRCVSRKRVAIDIIDYYPTLSHSNSITASNGAGIFTINSGTGEITVLDNTNLDYELAFQHVLTVQASNGSRTDTAAITIDVNNLNDNNPLISDATVSIDGLVA